jgi:glycosyltransferase involved in cell wall biosynthesis
MRLLFIVPAYNEAASLPGVMRDLQAHYPAADVAVINDGSSDDTAGVARDLGAHLLDLPYNLGIGGAVQTGLLFAHRGGYDVAVQFDGDGQHCADQVGALLAALAATGADVAIGSRFLGAADASGSGYHAPPVRRLGITILRLVLSAAVGQRITDSTSGFRAYGRAAIAFLARDYPHDYPEPESVVTLSRQGFRLCEAPVRMRARQGGRSSITPLRSAYYMMKVLLAIGIDASRRPVRRAAP